MVLTPRLCAELIRQRMGWEDDSNAARVINLLPQSLKAFGRKYAADPFTRELVKTPLSSTTLAIGSNGQVDLTTGYSSYQFLMEYFDLGEVYILPSTTCSVSTGTSANLIITTAGSTIANGTYTYQGYYNGRPWYSFSGDVIVRWEGTRWVFFDEVYAELYYSYENVTVPWEVVTWIVADDGTAPVPVLSYSGGPLTFALDRENFADLQRVRFTTTGSLPTGLALATDYYIVNYTSEFGQSDPDLANIQLSSTANGSTLVTVSSTGSGVLTMTRMNATGNPLQKVASPQLAALPQYLSDVFNYYFLQGQILTVMPIDGTYPTGSVALSVPAYPTNLAALPSSAEAEAAFLQELMNLVEVPVQAV